MLSLTTFFSIFLINSAFAEVLFLGQGYDISYDRRTDMDVVNIDSDLGSYGSYCSPLPDFPRPISQAAGGLVNGRIVTCGGDQAGNPLPRQECYALGATSWEPIGNLTHRKYDQAAATLPNGDLWLTGGRFDDYSIIFHSTEIVTANMEVIKGPDMPSAKYGHCVTQFNSTTMVLIGGFDDPYRVDFYNVETQKWSNYGPRTNFEHVYSSCVSFTDKYGNRKVVVIGDYYRSGSRKVEFLNFDDWEVLQELPVTMSYTKAVVYKDKIIVTGENYDLYPLQTSWEYDIHYGTWTPGFLMDPPISGHLSFLLPDSFCT